MTVKPLSPEDTKRLQFASKKFEDSGKAIKMAEIEFNEAKISLHNLEADIKYKMNVNIAFNYSDDYGFLVW